MNYAKYYIEWHNVDVSNLSIFITDYKQIGLQGITFDDLQNYTKKDYKPSQQDPQDGSAQEKRFGMMNILLQLWPGDLANQLKNLNNVIEANWKEVVGHPANTKLVSESKWLVWLGCFLAASVCGTNNLWNKSDMIGLVDLSKHMKKYR